MTIGEKVGQAGSYAREKASAARTAASDATRTARERASSARTSGAGRIEESPVIALVGGLALGAIAAAVLPRTQREQELLGGVGNRLTTGARNAVQAARDAGTSKLDEMGINKEAIGGAVKDLASTAAGAAKEAAASAGSAAKDSAMSSVSGGTGSTGSGSGSTGSGSTSGGGTGSTGSGSPSGSTGSTGSGLAGSSETSTSTAVI